MDGALGPNDGSGPALEGAREGAEQVRAFLEQSGVESDMCASRVSMKEDWSYGKSREFLGYRATVTFHVVTKALDRIDPLLVGAVAAGANGLKEVHYHTTELKEHRAMARAMAVESARRKAEIYCEASETRLGPVIHIEDVNPDLRYRRSRHAADHDLTAAFEGEDSPARAYDPGSIEVVGAVMLAYQLA